MRSPKEWIAFKRAYPDSPEVLYVTSPIDERIISRGREILAQMKEHREELKRDGVDDGEPEEE